MDLHATIVLWSIMLLGNGFVDGRQMCWSCQYVLNGSGRDCVTAPSNWTGGVSRVRCPYRCVLMAEFDAVSGKPTFFHRGCGTSKGDNPDGCSDNGSRHSCFYSCGDGDHYCNDQPLPRSPLLDEEDGLSAATSTYHLLLLKTPVVTGLTTSAVFIIVISLVTVVVNLGYGGMI